MFVKPVNKSSIIRSFTVNYHLPVPNTNVFFWNFKIFLKQKVFAWDGISKKVKEFVKGKHICVIKAQNLYLINRFSVPRSALIFYCSIKGKM